MDLLNEVILYGTKLFGLYCWSNYITQNNQIICEENNNGIIIYQYILNKLVGFTYITSSEKIIYCYFIIKILNNNLTLIAN